MKKNAGPSVCLIGNILTRRKTFLRHAATFLFFVFPLADDRHKDQHDTTTHDDGDAKGCMETRLLVLLVTCASVPLKYSVVHKGAAVCSVLNNLLMAILRELGFCDLYHYHFQYVMVGTNISW